VYHKRVRKRKQKSGGMAIGELRDIAIEDAAGHAAVMRPRCQACKGRNRRDQRTKVAEKAYGSIYLYMYIFI